MVRVLFLHFKPSGYCLLEISQAQTGKLKVLKCFGCAFNAEPGFSGLQRPVLCLFYLRCPATSSRRFISKTIVFLQAASVAMKVKFPLASISDLQGHSPVTGDFRLRFEIHLSTIASRVFSSRSG